MEFIGDFFNFIIEHKIIGGFIVMLIGGAISAIVSENNEKSNNLDRVDYRVNYKQYNANKIDRAHQEQKSDNFALIFVIIGLFMIVYGILEYTGAM